MKNQSGEKFDGKKNDLTKNEGKRVRSRAGLVNECIIEDNSKEITKAKVKYRRKTNAETREKNAAEEEKGGK
jgi:hypothetical protein